MIALAFAVLLLGERMQIARLPSVVQAELVRLDGLVATNKATAKVRRQMLELLTEHPLGASPATIALAIAGPVVLMSALGAGLAALVARRLAAPLSQVAAQAGRLRIRQELVNLAAVAEAVAVALEEQARSAGVALSLDLRQASVLGDPSRLTRAANALLDNVLRHGALGGEVRVETAMSDGRATLRVLDRGPGVPASFKVRILESFSRGPSAHASWPDGLGLGLALVRTVAEAHGVCVRAEAHLGGGAILSVDLPVSDPRTDLRSLACARGEGST